MLNFIKVIWPVTVIIAVIAIFTLRAKRSESVLLSVLSVTLVFATGGLAVTEPYYSQRARSVCVTLSAFSSNYAFYNNKPCTTALPRPPDVANMLSTPSRCTVNSPVSYGTLRTHGTHRLDTMTSALQNMSNFCHYPLL